MNARMIAHTGVDAEIMNANEIAEINISTKPIIPKYLAPKRSNNDPITGDNTKFTALPGNKIKPATTELNNSAPFKQSGNKIPVDNIHKIVMNTIDAPNINIGYLNTFKLSIGESILN